MLGRETIRARSRRIAAVAALCATASLAWAAAPATAAPGDLVYQDCLTGDTNVGPAGTNACSLITSPGVGAGGGASGLNEAQAVAVSPDGASLYALSLDDDAILRFNRNTATGALTYQDCITGELETGNDGGNGACAALPSDKSNGFESGFDQPYGIVISPDGTSVYVGAQQDDSIAHFQRSTSTGVLTYQGCITGETQSGPVGGGGNDSCLGVFTTPKSQGVDSGVDKVRALAIDANGETLYAGAPQDDSIARFTRNAMTGVLTYQGCLTAEVGTGPSGGGGNDSCAALPGISGGGANSGFDNPQALTVSPNGASLYAASGNDASITRFDRTAVTGVLTHQGCLTRDSAASVVACTQIPGGTAGGIDSGLDNLRAVVVSPSGESLYTVAGGDSAIAHFTRDTGTGALGFVSCITGESAIGPGGTNKCATQIASATPNGDQSGWAVGNSTAPALAINGAGTGVYFGTASDRSVVQLDRNTSTGALTPRRCLTSETESINAVCAGISPSTSFGQGTALNFVTSLALSPDGSSIYVAAPASDAIARFSFEAAAAAPPVVNPPVVTPTTTPPKKCKKGRKLKKGKCVKKKRKKRK